MDRIENDKSFATMLDGIGDAVGVEKKFWFVAIVNNNTEKSSSEKLKKMGVETYVPVQNEIRIRKSGKHAKLERVVIPSVIFIRCSENKRKEIVNYPFINRFMINRAGSANKSLYKPLAVIPDAQIQQLMFMIGNSDSPIYITNKPLGKGDLVRVIRGSLAGLEGEVIDLSSDKTELVVGLDYFGCAKLTIDSINLELIN